MDVGTTLDSNMWNHNVEVYGTALVHMDVGTTLDSNMRNHNVEVYGIGSGYSGWNLAFINARVPLLHIFDDQGPFVCSGIVSGQESLISGISILAHSQNVNVSMADPCDRFGFAKIPDNTR